MNLSLAFRIAWRYLRGRGSANAVPILSRIAMAAIGVGAGALIILLSVFNGFEHLIHDFYKAFYADVRITPARGKTFSPTPAQLQSLRGMAGVKAIAPVLEDAVLIGSESDQFVVTLRGIEPSYYAVSTVQEYITHGRDTVSSYPEPTALLGLTAAARLDINPDLPFTRILLHYPNAEARGALDAASAARTLELKADGVFQVEQEADERFVLAPLPLVRELMGRKEGEVSSLEMATAPGAEEGMQEKAAALFGTGYKVETRYEQNQSLYAVMRSEKWAVYAILLMVLLIASANLVSALSMLVLEKSGDLAILKTMGATAGTLRAAILIEGALWAAVGGVAGMAIGAVVCWGQQRWEWIKLEGAFLIAAYPVRMQWPDFVLVFLTVAGLGALAAVRPALSAGAAVKVPRAGA